MRKVMQRFMPVADALVCLIYNHLPSPVVAQRYRAAWLYAGDVSDAVGCSIARCDPTGATVMFVSKLVPMPKAKTFYAYGRVFSGTVRPGSKVWVHSCGDDGTMIHACFVAAFERGYRLLADQRAHHALVIFRA